MNKTTEFPECLKRADDLRSAIERLCLDIPVSENLAPLGEPLDIGRKRSPNRLCVQPMEGRDASADGSPGELTFRRYTRYAAGGFGLIWVEATAVLGEARSAPAQLCLHGNNVGRFAELVAAVRAAAARESDAVPLLILQLTHSGRFCVRDGVRTPVIAHHNRAADAASAIGPEYPVATDAFLDRLRRTFIDCALLARDAGFDGVDVKSCHGNLLSELLAAFTRPGRYGGDFTGRTRFLLETVRGIRDRAPELAVGVRLNAYDAVPYPYGFGADREDPRLPDLTEPIRLVRALREIGADVVNVSSGIPAPATDIGKAAERIAPETDSEAVRLERMACLPRMARRIGQAVPGFPVVGGGWSWFRHGLPFVAAGFVGSVPAGLVGLGRAALAYPNAARDILETGTLDPARCCTTCSACGQLLRDGGRTGCVLFDREVYGPEYRAHRRFAPDRLTQQSRRCHGCDPAPCSRACPAGIDVPGFLRAFAGNDIPGAYAVIRRANALPEMCARLCPVHLLCEGACVEQTLSGDPVPIGDLQYAVCRAARDRGLTGVRLPETRSGKRVAVVGAGPAGLACAAGLLERGHAVTIVERDHRPGGVPETAIHAARYTGARAEAEALLRPALDAGALAMEYGRSFGGNGGLDELRARYAAVLLATGLWGEMSLGEADGVVDALTFLRRVRNGETGSLPPRVAILGGGDCAMDAAAAARDLCRGDVYLVYGGSFADLHWHMSEGWFRAHHVHCLLLADPVGYETDARGALTGLRIRRMDYGPPDGSGRRVPAPVPNAESVLRVDMAIEAMGLRLETSVRDAATGIAFTDAGLIRTVREDSCATGVAGVFAAGAAINGGASVCRCIAEGMQAAAEIDAYLGEA